MTDETDKELVSRARGGNAAALEALVRRYLRAAYAVALAIVRNPADAEDVAQESFMTALQRLDQCRDSSRFAAWLLQGVRHRALNQVAQSRTRAALLDRRACSEAVEANAIGVLLRRRLLAALEHLTPVQREVVLLHDLDAWTHGEIGAALDISEVMSRQHLFVARRALRQFLLDDSQKEPVHG
jgi:RNA polymerase sigma-70 factor (ECF subfamily)